MNKNESKGLESRKNGILALKEETIRKIEQSIKDQEDAKKVANKKNSESLVEFYEGIEKFYRYILSELEELLNK